MGYVTINGELETHVPYLKKYDEKWKGWVTTLVLAVTVFCLGPVQVLIEAWLLVGCWASKYLEITMFRYHSH